MLQDPPAPVPIHPLNEFTIRTKRIVRDTLWGVTGVAITALVYAAIATFVACLAAGFLFYASLVTARGGIMICVIFATYGLLQGLWIGLKNEIKMRKIAFHHEPPPSVGNDDGWEDRQK